MVVLSGVATTSGLLSDNPGIEWAMSKLGGGGGEQTSITFSIYNSKESSIQIIICLFKLCFGIYNFMEDSFNIYSASYRTGTFIY